MNIEFTGHNQIPGKVLAFTYDKPGNTSECQYSVLIDIEPEETQKQRAIDILQHSTVDVVGNGGR